MTVLEMPTPDPRTLDEPARSFAAALFDRFAVKRVVGRGGMGIVYLARDRRLDRLVAIKTLPPQLAADPGVRERFLRETRTAGAMSHPNIVPIHGADEVGDHVFFVMGYVDGESLAARIRSRGPVEGRVLARYLADVATALAHAHARGIIHRDIKAENILIDGATDRALVTDFGIARAAEAAPLTATGQLLGTVYYVSPEQVSGDPVDSRSDLYSLGIVGYLALSGRFPFDSELASAVLVSHVTKTPPLLRDLAPNAPPRLVAIVERCMAKAPSQRYTSAEDVRAALEAFLADPPAGAPSGPRLISDTEAHQVWQRAAELQASTGIQPRPSPVPRARDTARDRTRTSGFGLGDVRSAALEAGIPDKYVEHALAEHGLVKGTATPVPRVSVPAQLKRSGWSWLFGRLDVVQQTTIAGEMQPSGFDRMLDTLRVGSNAVGDISARSRELSWHCSKGGRRLHVSVIPNRGTTTIRVSERLGGLAARVFVTCLPVIAAVSGIVGAIVGDGITNEEELGLMVGLLTAVTLLGVLPRKVVQWLRGRREGPIYIVMRALEAQARDSIPEDTE